MQALLEWTRLILLPLCLLSLLLFYHNNEAQSTVAASADDDVTIEPGRSMLATTPTAHTQSSFSKLKTPEQRAQWCASQPHLKSLYTNIKEDLKPWRSSGITLELMQQAIEKLTFRGDSPTRKGFLIAFRNGSAILPDEIQLHKKAEHHAGIFFLYMKALLDLGQLFGHLIPDTDFIINTFDCPGLLLRKGRPALPVMRFAKSKAHADILIPNFHSYSAAHNNALVYWTDEINRQHPWAERKPVLFGRFSAYDRYVLKNDPYTQRAGINGTNLCKATGHSWGASLTCDVRKYLIKWGKQHLPRIDMATSPKILMEQHAAYKYLVHVDGQGLSSRLEQMLPLGSLIFKEESGYYAFYHHLLKPYKHYVPFWKKSPDELLEVLKWAEDHDEEAQRIGRAAQDLATQYLNREARACYWFTLLKEYSALLRYEPSAATGKAYRTFNKPVEAYLDEEAVQHEQGKWLATYTFSP